MHKLYIEQKVLAETYINPFQTQLEFVFTDFLPNKNKQAIPKTEAEKIIASGRNAPIKINLVNGRESGHLASYPIGTISELWLDEDKIKARAIVWNDEFKKEDQFLKQSIAERELRTSWEIYYEDSENIDGIDWLKGCVVGASTIVDNPAYGNRTPIYAIAESTMEELRKFLCYLLDELWKVENQQEQIAALSNADEAFSMLEQFVSYLKNKEMNMMSMAETNEKTVEELEAQISTLNIELDALKNANAEREKAEAETQLYSARVKAITDNGITFDEDTMSRELVLAFSDETFGKYVGSLKVQKAQSSVTRVPDTITPSGNITIEDLVSKLNEANK